jgi:hypothetical protein
MSYGLTGQHDIAWSGWQIYEPPEPMHDRVHGGVTIQIHPLDTEAGARFLIENGEAIARASLLGVVGQRRLEPAEILALILRYDNARKVLASGRC